MIGQTISHYKILEKLGEGGMGVVYKAVDSKLNRPVALKFLPTSITKDDDEKARLLFEAQALSSLNHPHIATIFDVDDTSEQKFIALEFIEGGTLKQKMKQQQLPLREVLDYMIQITEGLAYAHKKEIVHRDIKTDNMMMTSEGKIKITDFGLAKLKGTTRITRTGSTMGTAAYMSPEQTRGESVDHRTDIWSLGVVLYEMLTGELPFKADHEAALTYLIVNQEPLVPSALDRKIPHRLDSLVGKMLVKDRAMRYQSMGEVLKTLQDVRKEMETSGDEGKKKAIAVLPFDNISPDKESDYFGDGLSEELIANLSRLKDMRVISRTTSMQYKGTKKDIKTIGRELGARYIMEGSVRKFQDNLRITAQLIDVESDAQLWAETYKGKLADVFDIQEKVSRQIVDALMVKLTPTEKVVLTKRSTLNAEAFDCNLRARDFLYRLTKDSVHSAIKLFQKAVELDPRYAEAHAGLGEAYAHLYQNFERKEAWLEKAVESSLAALMYDSSLSEGYTALGLAYFGLAQLKKKSLDEALTASQKAIELDPNNFIGYWILGRICHTTDRDREAVDLLKKVLALNPNFYSAYGDLLMLYERLGEKEKYAELTQTSLQFYPQYLSQHPDDARAHMFFAIDLTRAERFEEAKAEAAKAVEFSPGDPVMMYNAACFYARVGEKQLALNSLGKAFDAGYEHYEWVKRDPDLESIRNEPEYIEMMKGK